MMAGEEVGLRCMLWKNTNRQVYQGGRWEFQHRLIRIRPGQYEFYFLHLLD